MHWFLLRSIAVLALGGPGPMAASHLCFAAGINRLVLIHPDSVYETTWALADTGWQRLASSGPPSRELGGVACDTGRQRIVLFGGIPRTSGGVRLGDLWESNGQTWQRGSSEDPGPRSHHVMVYDEARAVTVMYGGGASDQSLSDDTWEWDGTRWKLAATVGPGRRAHFAMVYDPVRKRTVLFGGFDDKYRYNNETWAWDGKVWVRLAERGTAPLVRSHHEMAFDRRSGMIVLFGGLRAGNFRDPLGDTWVFDGDRWRAVETSTGPAPRSGHVMAYDRVRERVILYGGGAWSSQGSRRDRDTWAWDGERWVRLWD